MRAGNACADASAILQLAIAFVGVNDPHTAKRLESLCRDVCSGLSWVDWSIGSQGLYSVM